MNLAFTEDSLSICPRRYSVVARGTSASRDAGLLRKQGWATMHALAGGTHLMFFSVWQVHSKSHWVWEEE